MSEKQYFTGIDVINAPKIESLTVTEDGTYTASSDVIGYNPVVVNTNQPWEPLEDGYSNFWFELTDDTLSPWLNFSAKNNDATIDWGDGSGEVALDTLTPTHTYSKAGKYVVKVKGVTGIAQQLTSGYDGSYTKTLRYVELNDEITFVGTRAFTFCARLEQAKIGAGVTGINTFGFVYCSQLSSISLGNNITAIGGYCFYFDYSLKKIVLPSSIITIGDSGFANCTALNEIHVQSTTPPTLGSGVFYTISPNFIIYVPVGYGDTYKAASGWSTYADHILEEGQTPNRAMLAKFNSDNTDNEEMR